MEVEQSLIPNTPSEITLARSRTSFLNTPLPYFKTQAFEGPLDLLLHLIRINKVDIYDIPIAEITEQYLAYVALLEQIDLASVGEYVVVAATLIEIKSRLLLPLSSSESSEEEDDPRTELVARLLEYQSFHGAVETLRDWEAFRRTLYFRSATEQSDDYILPIAEAEADVSQLFHALSRLLAQAGVDEKPVTAVTPRRRLSLRLKMAEMLRHLQRAGDEGLMFESLFDLPCPCYDIVLVFLGLLELIKQERVRFVQRGAMQEIRLYFVMEEAVVRV